MAESTVLDNSEMANGIVKRKRGESSSSPDERRVKKATASPTVLSAHPAVQGSPMSVTPGFENAVEAAQAAVIASGISGGNVPDLSPLQRAAAADHPHPHSHPHHSEAADPANASSTAAAALTMYPTLHIPQSTEEQFAAQAHAEHAGAYPSPSVHDVGGHPDGMSDGAYSLRAPQPIPTHPGQPLQPQTPTQNNGKPSVGSAEWHKQRKENHKEVERRRRETINEGINELSKIVPGCEKNKGSILQRAVHFINQLKENEQQNIEKWTLEKLLTEQALTEITSSNDKLKREFERVYKELEMWKQVAQGAGLHLPAPDEEQAQPAAAATTTSD